MPPTYNPNTNGVSRVLTMRIAHEAYISLLREAAKSRIDLGTYARKILEEHASKLGRRPRKIKNA